MNNQDTYNQFIMWAMAIGLSIIALIILTSPYRTRKRMIEAKEKFCEWLKDRGTYTQEMYINDVKTIGVATTFAMQLVDFLMKSSIEPKTIVYPKMDEHLVDVWGFDDDIADPVNYVLTQNNIKRQLKWNDKRLYSLVTIRDLLVFIKNEIESEKLV